ncbi:hypothetical protein B0H14DRAFT_2590924 [Mycena olivaceomarginata]|nr:hypothetical protein B0H14DRAFT_2590924 [Mycena olivaceomarginata]
MCCGDELVGSRCRASNPPATTPKVMAVQNISKRPRKFILMHSVKTELTSSISGASRINKSKKDIRTKPKLEVVPRLQKSDMAWLDEEQLSRVHIREFRVTAEVSVERVEYLTELPSLCPISETPTAFVIDRQDSESNITKNRTMYTVDALIKPNPYKFGQDSDSWKGNTGTGDSHVWVSFEPGAEPILRRRSRLNCKVRRDLDPASRDAVFAAQCQMRRDEGTTAECKVTHAAHRVPHLATCAADERGVPHLLCAVSAASGLSC